MFLLIRLGVCTPGAPPSAPPSSGSSSAAAAAPAVHRDGIACPRRISIRRLSVLRFVYHIVFLIVIFILLGGVPDVAGGGD